MDLFSMYLQLGLEHITDLAGYDHILFIATLISAYQWRQGLRILKLVTAFTLGHSASLALSVMGYLHFSTAVIEFLIPTTIALVSLSHFFQNHRITQYYFRIEYSITALFGLIHGMGFSILLSELLGEAQSIAFPLLAFNIGLELGQIIIVIILLSLSTLLGQIKVFKKEYWQKGISSLCLILALFLMYQRSEILVP